MLLVFSVYLIFQLHAATYHGSWGQDFIIHKTWVAEAADHPWEFLASYPDRRSSPPLYHVLAGFVKRAVGAPHFLFAIALMNIAFSVIGALCFYGIIRRLISCYFLRLSCLIFILFLPAAMIRRAWTRCAPGGGAWGAPGNPQFSPWSLAESIHS